MMPFSVGMFYLHFPSAIQTSSMALPSSDSKASSYQLFPVNNPRLFHENTAVGPTIFARNELGQQWEETSLAHNLLNKAQVKRRLRRSWLI